MVICGLVTVGFRLDIARAGPAAHASGSHFLRAAYLLAGNAGSFPSVWQVAAVGLLPFWAALPVVTAIMPLPGGVRLALIVLAEAVLVGVLVGALAGGLARGGGAGAVLIITGAVLGAVFGVVLAVVRSVDGQTGRLGVRRTTDSRSALFLATVVAVVCGAANALIPIEAGGTKQPEQAAIRMLHAALSYNRLEALQVLSPNDIKAAGSVTRLGRSGQNSLQLLARAARLYGVHTVDEIQFEAPMFTSKRTAVVAVRPQPGSVADVLSSNDGVLGKIKKRLGQMTSARPGLRLDAVLEDGRWFIDAKATKSSLLQAPTPDEQP